MGDDKLKCGYHNITDYNIDFFPSKTVSPRIYCRISKIIVTKKKWSLDFDRSLMNNPQLAVNYSKLQE